METRRGDEGCDQTNQIIVHVSRVTKGRRTSSHDGRHLECIKLHLHVNICVGVDWVFPRLTVYVLI